MKAITTFFETYLNVPESKVRYLTRPTAIDRFLEKTFIKLLPESVTPNQITRFRLLSIPVIAICLVLEWYAVGTVLFLFSAFSDAIDGALARTKKQVTVWGTFYDPIADKLLIGMVATIVITKYVSPYLALFIIILEILLVASAYYRYKGRVVPAKTMGKSKMVLQCVGVILLLFYILFPVAWLFAVATWALYISVVFSLLSLLVFRSI
ncbi:MAG: CDP-alcohol phosphatidyltransferase family protein [bacterium]|nr:CDP-alcohol phosphatidyltransferase family protein [bacterium]